MRQLSPVAQLTSTRRRRRPHPSPCARFRVDAPGWLSRPDPGPGSSKAGEPGARALRPWTPLVSYSAGLACAEPAAVAALWAVCGVATASDQRVAVALQRSYRAVAAYGAAEPGSAQQVLVGFARAVSDGAFTAVVSDVAVLPDWRRRGVGTELLRRLRRATVAEEGPLSQLFPSEGPTSLMAFPPPSVRPFFACVARSAAWVLPWLSRCPEATGINATSGTSGSRSAKPAHRAKAENRESNAHCPRWRRRWLPPQHRLPRGFRGASTGCAGDCDTVLSTHHIRHLPLRTRRSACRRRRPPKAPPPAQ